VRVALCPTCNKSYPANVRLCPIDGAVLAVTGTDQTIASGASGGGATVAGKSNAAVRTQSQAEVAAVADELAVGMHVGEYQVTGKLGEGGMGTVYAGLHPVIGKKAAIKVLSAQLSHDATIVQRFVQEARAVNQIGHRNIVDIFAFGQLPSGRQYFVMELLAGKSLRERLEKGAMPYAEAFGVLVEVCDALMAAHAEGIVHRDLKPDNIFLAENKAGERTVKLLDFGIAKLLNAGEGGTPLRQTNTGVPMGTPLYMSPEQCLGRAVDARTDVYALGVILFEIFTGKLPFCGPSYIETVNGHLSQPPPKPTTLADVPAALEQLILGCLAKDASARPALTDVRAQLTTIAASLGVDVGRRTSDSLPATAAARAPARRQAGAPRRSLVIYGAIALGSAALVAVVVARLVPHKPAAPTVAAAPARLVKLQIVTNPSGARVAIGGKKQPLLTPYTFEVPWQKSLAVHIERAGYKDYDETLALADDEEARPLNVELVPSSQPGGRLVVRANSTHVRWTLDGKPVGGESDRLSLDDVAAGDHTLRAEARGYQPRQEEIAIQPRELASLEWNLQPAPARHGGKHAEKPIDDGAGDSSWPPK
jgi:tRNA A-37 threonylcarbamoyl transferase component Bud32